MPAGNPYVSTVIETLCSDACCSLWSCLFGQRKVSCKHGKCQNYTEPTSIKSGMGKGLRKAIFLVRKSKMQVAWSTWTPWGRKEIANTHPFKNLYSFFKSEYCLLEGVLRKLLKCLCFGFGKKSNPLGKDLYPGSQSDGAIKIMFLLAESITKQWIFVEKPRTRGSWMAFPIVVPI